jgi:hypothetical protein
MGTLKIKVITSAHIEALEILEERDELKKTQFAKTESETESELFEFESEASVQEVELES